MKRTHCDGYCNLFGGNGYAMEFFPVTKAILLEQKLGQPKHDFGFVHYADHSSAIKAIDKTKKYVIEGRELLVYLARPFSDKKPQTVANHSSFQKSMFSNFHPLAGYGYNPNMYILVPWAILSLSSMEEARHPKA